MITDIGIVSGKILNLLEEKKRPVSMTEIKFYLDDPLDVIYMSIGWLVRERFIRIVVREGEKYLCEISTERVFSKKAERVEHINNM